VFRYYYIFKKKDKRTRWIYDKEKDVWKKSRSSKYSNNFLSIFAISVFSVVFFGAALIMALIHLPFAGAVFAIVKGEPLLLLVWILYFITMIVFGYFMKSWWKFYIFGFIISTIVLFSSDILMSEFDTVFYFYPLYGFIISSLYLIFLRFLRLMLNRKRVENKQPKEKVKLSSF